MAALFYDIKIYNIIVIPEIDITQKWGKTLIKS